MRMLVTAKLLGGTGNCLFIIATTIAYALKHNCDYCIPLVIDNPHEPGQKVFHSDKLKYCDDKSQIQKGDEVEYIHNQIYTEPFFQYQEIPKVSAFALSLHGYFQSAKHFDEYKEEILKILDIPYEFKKGWCSIHVRRNDYLSLPTIHPVVTSEYLINAIDEIFNLTKCTNYLVFGDDLEWNKNYFRNISAYEESSGVKTVLNFKFSENKSAVEDLSSASSCEHSIGSNSSYSWWIYYLNQNKNKVGVFPKKDKWFGVDLPHDVKDLYMPEWVLI